MSYVLLLTATIHPRHSNLTNGRNNPLERENDYYDAVLFYLSQGFKVVFVENSNTVSEKIISLKTRFENFEYHSFETKASHLGKSAGEVEIFHYALDNSRLLKNVDYLVKVTGRYIIKNLMRLLNLTNEVEKEIYINPTRNLKWADSRLMIMRKSFFYKYFLKAVDLYLDEEKKVYMEQTYMRSLFLYLLDGGDFSLWPTYPIYNAYDGTHNEKISFNLLKEWKYYIYYKLKKFAFKHRA